MAIKRTTSKQAAKPGGRRPFVPPKKSNPLPMILGIGGGAVVLILIIAVVATQGGKKPADTPREDTPARVDPTAPDYKRTEQEGRIKLDQALKSVRAKAAELSALKPEEKINALKDLSGAIKNKDEAFGLLNTANQMIERYLREGGRNIKKIDVGALERDWAAATSRLVDTLEGEGNILCERGYQKIQVLQPKWNDTSTPNLKTDLKQAIDDISHGINLYEWANQLTGRTFDTTKYGQARKLAGNVYSGLK